MRGTAASSAAGWGDQTTGVQHPDDVAGPDVHDAWRLAYAIVADDDLATEAVRKAFVDAAPPENNASPSRLEFLAAAFRISLTRGAENPGQESDSAVTAALWQLAPEQRGALWLAKVDELDNEALGAVLGLTAANAGHVARRAAEWLDVTLDHESGPLCPEEVRLDDFLNDRLPDDETEAMRDHVPDCPTCRTKARAFEELADLREVLLAAVPEPPPELDLEAMGRLDRTSSAPGNATLAEPARRIPAVRPLALCCAALLILGLIGVALLRPARHAADPVSPSAPRAIVPRFSTTTVGSGGVVATTAGIPTKSATTVVVTTTSIPKVTFPTTKP